MYSKTKAEAITTINVVIVGLTLIKKPRAIPARATCDKVSAKSDCLRNTDRVSPLKLLYCVL